MARNNTATIHYFPIERAVRVRSGNGTGAIME